MKEKFSETFKETAKRLNMKVELTGDSSEVIEFTLIPRHHTSPGDMVISTLIQTCNRLFAYGHYSYEIRHDSKKCEYKVRITEK